MPLSSTYVEKMELLFSDKSKFELIEQPDPNLIQKRENTLMTASMTLLTVWIKVVN